MKITVLGSTSSGNCTLVWNEDEALLIDCGLSFGYTRTCLQELSIPLTGITAVLLTHCHGDHVNDTMVKQLTRHDIPVMCHSSIKKHLRDMSIVCRDACDSGAIRTFDDNIYHLGSFSVRAFPLIHDAPGGCYGFNILEKRDKKTLKFTIATDMGGIDEMVVANFLDSHAIVIESNYDPAMLESSPRMPWLKKRIRESHLSNGECSDLLFNVLAGSLDKPAAVILAHLSEECNTPTIALAAAGESIGNMNIPLIVASKNRMTEVISI